MWYVDHRWSYSEINCLTNVIVIFFFSLYHCPSVRHLDSENLAQSHSRLQLAAPKRREEAASQSTLPCGATAPRKLCTGCRTMGLFQQQFHIQFPSRDQYFFQATQFLNYEHCWTLVCYCSVFCSLNIQNVPRQLVWAYDNAQTLHATLWVMINILPMCQWQCDFFDLIFLIGVSCHSMFILSHCRSYNVTAHNWRGNWCYLLLFRLQRGERSCWITCCSLESLQHYWILSSILLFLIGLLELVFVL